MDKWKSSDIQTREEIIKIVKTGNVGGEGIEAKVWNGR